VVTGRTSGLPNPPCSLSESDQANLMNLSKAASPDPLSQKKENEEIQFEEMVGGGFSKRLVGGTLLLLPCCLMLCWYGYTHWAAEKSLEEAITNADRLDPGWRLQDLEDKRAVIPDPENSSLLIREVKAHLPENWEYARYQKFYEQFVDLDPEKQLNDEQVKKLTEVFENHEPVLILARRLADMPRGRAPITWSKDGLFIILNDTQNARTTVNFLRYDALLRSQENDADGALESCRAIVNAGRSIGDEPSLISTLMRIATNGIAHNALERSLAQGQPRDESMRVLQRLLEDEEKEPILLYGIRGERACWDRVLERLQNGTTGVKNVRGLWGGADEVVLMSGSLKGQRALLLQIMNENVEAAKLPLEQQEAEFTSIDKSISLKSAVVRMLIPAGVRIEQAFVRSRALLRTDIVALAVERYRREHGRWPDSLAELVPNYLQQLYTDPYDGKPLRYRRNSDGVVIYSIGPDKTDDGGKLDRVKVGTTGSDVGIQLWDPEKRRQPPPPPTADATAAEAQESPDDDK